MVDFLTISWWIGILGTLIGVIAVIISTKTIIRTKIDLNTKKSLSWLVLTGACAVIYTTMIVIFGILKFEPSNNLWIAFPLIYLLVALSWFMGTHTLLGIVTGGDEK